MSKRHLLAMLPALGVVAVLAAAAVLAPPAAGQEAPAASLAEGSGRLDLNRATLPELASLPMPPQVARNILNYRKYVSYFTSIYDLLEVEGVTAAMLQELRPLVATMPPAEADEAIARLEASYRQVRQYLGQEGANEGLVDEYLDQIREPVNVNDLDLFELQSYQNVSPVDATAILKARQRLGAFEDSRQLRQAEGLRYWAFRNLRDFIVYSDTVRGREQGISGSYSLRYYDTPLTADDLELYNAFFFDQNPSTDPYRRPLSEPAMTHKLRVSMTEHLKAGILTHRGLGEDSWRETAKGFVGLQRLGRGEARLKNLVLGHYRVGFGQGLVMDNTDFVLFRKTGYGYNKRPQGVRGDLSRSQEFALFGAAVEGQLGPVHGTFFASSDRKDAVLNSDGTLNNYIVLRPRFSAETLEENLEDAGSLRRDGMQEDLVGGNVKVRLGTGSYVGVSGFEASYDRGWRADVNTLVRQPGTYLDARDSELYTSYTSVFENPDGTTDTYKYRRIYGAEFQTVWRNTALQGEYAWLQDPRAGFLHGYLGDAYILNAYSQWGDLELLAIWRDYDLGYDNPYNRAFSNDTRYEQTLLDSYYRLVEDPFSYLALTTAQPKPERGLFFDTRYRISRTFTLTGFQYDDWERKADGMDMRRYTLRAEYQPIFNLRLRARHRFSSRSEQLPTDVRRFRSWETRWELHALLSNYSRLRFMYMTSNVEFPPRPRLSFPPETGSYSALGTAAMPAHAFQAAYEHNVNEWMRLLVSTEIYDGFLWNFEGNEFVLLDGSGFRNWLQIESRIGQRLLMQLKVTRDHNLPHTFVDVRRFQLPSGTEPEGRWVPRDQTTFRLQMDYTF